MIIICNNSTTSCRLLDELFMLEKEISKDCYLLSILSLPYISNLYCEPMSKIGGLSSFPSISG